jgi:hypothetical protein
VTGPEHYSEGERLLTAADEYEDEGDTLTANQRRITALTHAVLALVAATAQTNLGEYTAWQKAVGL